MTRFRFLTFVIGFGLTTTAFGAPPQWTGFTGLADRDGDGYPAFQGTATAASSGYTGVLDCNDTHANMNPGLTEIVGDGIDQDCSGADMVFPVADPVVVRYRANYSSWNAVTFVTEYGRCKAASSRCTPDDVAGKFVITNPEVDAFRDIYRGTTKILGADGVREVVSLEEASHFRGGSSASGGGVGKSYVDASSGVLRKEAAQEREERLAADAELDRRIDTIESGNSTRDGAISGAIQDITALEAALAAQDDRIDAEAQARAEADTRIEGKADAASRTASAAASHGPLLEAYGLVGAMMGTPVVDDGETARKGLGLGGGAGVNFGLDADTYRVNGFADIIIGGDGGAGPAHSEAVGAEATFRLGYGNGHLGPFLAYTRRSTQVDALQSQVVGTLPIGGISLAVPFGHNGAAHGLVTARVGCGPEFIGMAGDTVTSGRGFGCRATMGIGGGAGALE